MLVPELASTVVTWCTNRCIPFYISAPNKEINFFIFCSTIVNIVFSFINISTLHIFAEITQVSGFFTNPFHILILLVPWFALSLCFTRSNSCSHDPGFFSSSSLLDGHLRIFFHHNYICPWEPTNWYKNIITI